LHGPPWGTIKGFALACFSNPAEQGFNSKALDCHPSKGHVLRTSLQEGAAVAFFATNAFLLLTPSSGDNKAIAGKGHAQQ